MEDHKIEIQVSSFLEKIAKEQSLQTLSDHLSAEALALLAEISKSKGAEEKLLQNQRLIKSFIQ